MELIETGAVVNSSSQDLKDQGLYYNRPADELIFLTSKEHHRLHGRNLSEESRRKLRSNTNVKGKRRFNNGAINVMAFECPEGFVPGMLKKEPKQEPKPTPKSDFESKIDTYFEKYYGGIC